MRPIKFRAWDGYKMIMPKDNAYYQHYISMCGNIVQKSSEGMDCFGGGDRWARVEPLELMQFTGLQDSEGVDIYEGDVWLRDDFIALVEFKYSQWTLTKAESSICFQYPYFYSNAKTGSVIGNIHQNPELLELKK